jgi:hypothetical protein
VGRPPKNSLWTAGGEELAKTAETLLEEADLREGYLPPASVPAFDKNTTLKARELKLLQKLRVRELRELALQEFWLFLTEVLYAKPDQKRNYTEEFHEFICQELQSLESEEGIVICVPREARKTMLVLAWLCWQIVRNPNIRIKIVAAKITRAKELSRMLLEFFLRDKYQKFPRFQDVFPDFVITRRQELLQAQQFTHPLRDAAYLDPTVFATYLGATGSGGRCDIMWLDDAWDNSTLTTPEMGAKAHMNFFDLMPLVETSELGEYKNIIITTTPWKHYDPTATFLGFSGEQFSEEERAVLPRFRFYVRHALENKDVPCTRCPKSVTDRYPHGQPDFFHGTAPLEPLFNRETYQRKYDMYKVKPELGEQSFWLQYMVVYTNPDLASFKDSWFVWHERADWGAPKKRVLLIDSADKDFQKRGVGDYAVALFGSYDDEGRLILRHGIRTNKMTRIQFVQAITAWCTASGWWPRTAVKEKVGNDTFLTDLQEQFAKLDKPLAVVPAPRVGLGDKAGMILRSLQGPFEKGDVVFGSHFPKEIYEQCKYELMNLGTTVHDDVPDTLRLGFIPEVRPSVRVRDQQGADRKQLVRPELGLFDPRRKKPVVDLNPAPDTAFDKALQDKSVRRIFAAVGSPPTMRDHRK